jgi:hypothetical protein
VGKKHFEDVNIFRWHNNIQIVLKERGMKKFTGFVWCRIDTNGELF